MVDKRCRDGYGKHVKHPITFTAIDGEPVVKVSLGMQRFMIIDVADMWILEENSFYAQIRTDG